MGLEYGCYTATLACSESWQSNNSTEYIWYFKGSNDNVLAVINVTIHHTGRTSVPRESTGNVTSFHSFREESVIESLRRVGILLSPPQ